ncbi:MAG: polysaccharide biosynthesis C-terminal domain-containing protein, partial [Thermoplasmata archaeon]
ALHAFLTLYHMVLLPILSRIRAEKPALVPRVLEKSQRLLFSLGVPAAVGGWFFAEAIVTLFYGDAFLESGQSLRILLFTVALSAAVMGNGALLAAAGLQRFNLYVGSAAAVTTVGMSLVLIPLWGHVGAATAVLATSALRALLSILITRRLVVKTDLKHVLLRPVAAGFVLVVVLLALPGLSLWVGVALGAVVYFGVLALVGGITREDLGLVRDGLKGALFR